MLALVVALFVLFGSGAKEAATGTAAWLGTWEGESTCTVPDSPCRNEHVVYEIKSAPAGMTIDGYKIVNGKKDFMGTLACGAVKGSQVSCSAQIPNKKRIDDWVFELKKNTIDGTLYVDTERTVYRRIHIVRKDPRENAAKK
jgi:hypothetical protein